MSGIFGVWNLGGRPVNASGLNRCLGRITHLGPHASHYWLQGAIGLGCKRASVEHESNDEHQPLTFRHIVCVFEGRLDDRAELCRRLNDHPLAGSDCPDSNLAMAAYDRFGESFVQHLEGDFVVAVFDRQMNRLLVARDRLGLRPLCYARCGDALLFGSEAKALLEYPGMTAVPDDTMLADFTLYFLSAEAHTRTFFQGIHSLPPGHVLAATAEHLSVDRYFEFDTTRRQRFPAFRDYAAAFHALFVASVRNRLRSRSPVAIAVSGGLDSSYIYCVAQRLVRNEPGLCPAVLGFNYGGPPGSRSDESGFIRQLEHACDTKIEHVAQRPGFLECSGEDVWFSESPRVESVARLRQAVLRRIRDTGAQRVLTGHWGDQLLSDSDYLLDLLRSGKWRLLERHRKSWGVSAPRLAVRFVRDLVERRAPRSLYAAMRRTRSRLNGTWKSPWFTPWFRQLLLERFTAERLSRRAGTSHAWAMYQQVRRGYQLHCMEWNVRVGGGYGLEMAFPYLDRELIQFLMSIPGEIQSHEGVSRAVMREAMRGTVPDAIVERRNKGEFTDLANKGIEHDFAAIREMLGPDALSVRFGYVDGPVLWGMLDQWGTAIRHADDVVLTDRIIDLCGLELLLRRFFSDRKDEPTLRTEASMASC